MMSEKEVKKVIDRLRVELKQERAAYDTLAPGSKEREIQAKMIWSLSGELLAYHKVLYGYP